MSTMDPVHVPSIKVHGLKQGDQQVINSSDSSSGVFSADEVVHNDRSKNLNIMGSINCKGFGSQADIYQKEMATSFTGQRNFSSRVKENASSNLSQSYDTVSHRNFALRDSLRLEKKTATCMSTSHISKVPLSFNDDSSNARLSAQHILSKAPQDMVQR